MDYAIRKVAEGRWSLMVDGTSGPSAIATFTTRRAALNHARLLAGWRGRVRVIR